MSISFVLVEPSRATNVGAAARAIKTMGFNKLILVGSELHLTPEAGWLAHGATDILESVEVMPDLASVRQRFDILVATTARERGTPRQFFDPQQLSRHLEQTGSASIALLFGREASGLSNDELESCDLFSYVPLANDYPSLNLAQAVMVYSYALSQTLSNIDASLSASQATADSGQLQALKHKAEALLVELEAGEDKKLKQWLLDGMARLGERDCKLAHQLLNDIKRKLG
ncbi:tRNA/rRNA methyltransferase [Shewanella sp. AS16]|uniref:tRNA/rRNA methyltransferase n=1 Tax=Shewanella sp. AS16 TaxID=2907625 RepID=UPI001F35CDA1|nr:tRNA/rRNA methyltransferase [Shewanella sp. AS16]MCE9687263.1 tRNA/rRNA methyltransferase [Shewanella sp. AS16]